MTEPQGDPPATFVVGAGVRAGDRVAPDPSTGRLVPGEPPGQDDDLPGLRERFPGWEIGARWSAAGSGPDCRLLEASREGHRVTAWDAGQLATGITRVQARTARVTRAAAPPGRRARRLPRHPYSL